MLKRTLLCCAVLTFTVAMGQAATITVGEYLLDPDTSGQPIYITVAGGDLVPGLNLFAQVGDGGPELADHGLPPGTDGPAITEVDLKTGTIFDGMRWPRFHGHFNCLVSRLR